MEYASNKLLLPTCLIICKCSVHKWRVCAVPVHIAFDKYRASDTTHTYCTILRAIMNRMSCISKKSSNIRRTLTLRHLFPLCHRIMVMLLPMNSIKARTVLLSVCNQIPIPTRLQHVSLRALQPRISSTYCAARSNGKRKYISAAKSIQQLWIYVHFTVYGVRKLWKNIYSFCLSAYRV